MEPSPLEKALALALQAHQGQTDKSGLPYILHPIRLMMRVEDPQAKVVALLHDVLEDSDMTENDLQNAGFDKQIIEAVVCLTKTPSIDYMEYIRRIKKNSLATQVKLVDLEDNLNANRLKEIEQKDCERMARYLQARKILLEKPEKQG